MKTTVSNSVEPYLHWKRFARFLLLLWPFFRMKKRKAVMKHPVHIQSRAAVETPVKKGSVCEAEHACCERVRKQLIGALAAFPNDHVWESAWGSLQTSPCFSSEVTPWASYLTWVGPAWQRPSPNRDKNLPCVFPGRNQGSRIWNLLISSPDSF